MLELELGKLMEKRKEVDEQRFQTFFPRENVNRYEMLSQELEDLKIARNRTIEKLTTRVPGRAREVLLHLMQ